MFYLDAPPPLACYLNRQLKSDLYFAEIDGRFMSALKGFWTSVESTWYFYLPAAVLICGLLLVLCVYKCKQSSDLKSK